MDVILKEDIKNLGEIGDVVSVKPGYGRNFLVPQGKAVFATADNLKQLELQKEELKQKQEQELSILRDKAQQFEVNNKVSVNFWWPNLEVQVRIEGIISKCEEKFSDEHFQGRDPGKNIAAIITEQSKEIESYELLKDKYQAMKEKVENGEYTESRPEKWGGYQIKVNFFEFWEANDDRLNYRECYRRDGDSWQKYFLQS